MQVKNEYVKLRTSKKEYIFKNWIYDSYLKLFSERQKQLYNMSGITETNSTELVMCCIKVDKQLSNYKNATVEQFDIFIPYKNISISGNEKGVSTIYEYSSLMINYANKLDLTEYDGKKITAIGFCGITHYVDTTPIYELFACIDTSYYSITIDVEQGIEVTRKDTVASNAICDGIEYPLHLAPVLQRTSEPDDKYKGAIGKIRAILYSVGFGSARGKMQQEFIVGKDVKIETIDDFKYGVAMKNPINTPKYPSASISPSNNRYPTAPKYLRSLYLKEKNLYPSFGKYPMKAGYNYIIFKYRLYYNILNNIEYLNEYYSMSYVYNPKGAFIATNTIERGD